MNTVPHIESPRHGRTRRAARLGFAVLALLTAMPLVAQQPRVYREGRSWVEESSGTLPAARVLRVNSDVGNVRIQGGAPAIKWVVKKRSYVGSEAEARKQFTNFRVNAGKSGEAAVLDAQWVSGRGNRFGSDIYIEVPRDMESVQVETKGGTLSVIGTNGKVDLKSLGGNVTVDDIGGQLHASTMGGNVNIGSVRSDAWVRSGGGNVELNNAQGRVEVNTMGGNITVNGMNAGMLQTGGGSIEVGKCNGELKAMTAGGSLDIGYVGGNVALQTGGGNIKVGGSKGKVMASSAGGNVELWKLWQGAQVQTGAGSITVEFLGGKGSFSESALRTAAGDVMVYLSGALPVTVHAASELASGRGIRSDFPELKITSEGGEFGPRTMYADGAINGGGPLLKVRTTIGQIEIRKAK